MSAITLLALGAMLTAGCGPSATEQAALAQDRQEIERNDAAGPERQYVGLGIASAKQVRHSDRSTRATLSQPARQYSIGCDVEESPAVSARWGDYGDPFGFAQGRLLHFAPRMCGVHTGPGKTLRSG